MARTVKVQLDADAGEYISSTEKATVSTVGLKEEVDGLDDKLKKIPADATKAAATMKLLGGDADGVRGKLHDLGPEATNSLQLIDKQLEETRTKLRAAAADFNQTGSAESFSLWQKLTADHGELEKLKKNLTSALTPDVPNFGKTAYWDKLKGWVGMVGSDAGKVFDQSFESAVQGGSKGLVKTLSENFASDFADVTSPQGAITVAIYTGLAAALTVGLAPLLSGAVVGGSGIGLIAVAIAAQFRSQQIKDAAAGLGSELKAELGNATRDFTAPVESALLDLRGFTRTLNFKGIFDPLVGEVGPLEVALEGFIRNLLTGVQNLSGKLGPVFDVIDARLPWLGKQVGDFFTRISRNAGDNASALDALITVIGNVIRIAGVLIETFDHWWRALINTADGVAQAMAAAFGWIPGVGDQIKGAAERINDLATEANGGTTSLNNAKSAADGLSGALGSGGLTGSATGAADAVTQLDQAALEFHNEAMTAKQDSLSFRDSVDSLTQALKNSKKGLDDNTQAGRQAEEAYLAGVQAAQQHAAAVQQSTGSAVLAARAYAQDKAQLDAAARSAGATKSQIAALNAALDNTVKVRRGSVVITVSVKGNGQSLLTRSDSNDIKILGTHLIMNRRGGIYEHAAEGVLNQAGVYPPTDPARYAFAEPSTGGEAFVPKYGDYMRSTAILDQAARWYGGRFVAAGSQPAPAVSVGSPNVNVQVFVGDEDITARTRVVVRQELAGVAGAVSGGVRL